jgi:hypothetical protein
MAASKKRREPHGLVSRYARALGRGEDVGSLVFFRPRGDESLVEFADYVFDLIGLPEDPDDPETELNPDRGQTRRRHSGGDATSR